jgi:hypothetical protein
MMIFYTCFSISYEYRIIRAAAFNLGFLHLRRNGTDIPVFKISIGLRAIGVDGIADFGRGERVFAFDEFCHLGIESSDVTSQFIEPSDCSKCQDASAGMIASLFVSLSTYFPNLTTDVLRL